MRQRKRTSQIVMDYSHTDYAKLWRKEVEQRKRIENELAALRQAVWELLDWGPEYDPAEGYMEDFKRVQVLLDKAEEQ